MRIPAAFCTAILGLGVLLVFVAPRANAQETAVSAPAPVAALVEQGDNYMASRNYLKALESYQKAEKVSHHECAKCLIREVSIYKTAGDFSSALDCAKKAQKEAGANKEESAEALMVQASLLAAQASKPKDKKLAQAVADTREAITLEPTLTLAHFNLGVLLIRQNQDADGIAELKTYLGSSGTDAATAKAAREDIADPRRAREPYAPEFSFTTLEDGQVSLASLHGKVALLDFWGSWCPPCRASIPTVAALQKDFAKKGVQIVGISSDSDANAWRKFVAANRMVWPEYLDSDNSVQSAFQIDSFPTYIVLDRNGVIQFRQSGFSEQESPAELYGAIDRALKVKLDTSAPPVATADSSAAPQTNGGAQTGGTAAAAASATAATSAYGYPEPAYARPPVNGDGVASAASAAPAESRPGFWVLMRVATSANGATFTRFTSSTTLRLRNVWLAALPHLILEGKQGTAIVQFSIDRDGKIIVAPVILHSAGDASLDNAALAAIAATAPYSSLPPDLSVDTIELQVAFLYNESLPQAGAGSN